MESKQQRNRAVTGDLHNSYDGWTRLNCISKGEKTAMGEERKLQEGSYNNSVHKYFTAHKIILCDVHGT